MIESLMKLVAEYLSGSMIRVNDRDADEVDTIGISGAARVANKYTSG